MRHWRAFQAYPLSWQQQSLSSRPARASCKAFWFSYSHQLWATPSELVSILITAMALTVQPTDFASEEYSLQRSSEKLVSPLLVWYFLLILFIFTAVVLVFRITSQFVLLWEWKKIVFFLFYLSLSSKWWSLSGFRNSAKQVSVFLFEIKRPILILIRLWEKFFFIF